MYLLFASMNMKKIAFWDARKASLNFIKTHIFRLMAQFNIKKGRLIVQVNF